MRVHTRTRPARGGSALDEREVGAVAKCVVCAANGIDTYVDEDEAIRKGLTSEHRGETYYQERMQHKEMFDEEPERWLRMARERGKWAA